jgi:hypothetical protein
MSEPWIVLNSGCQIVESVGVLMEKNREKRKILVLVLFLAFTSIAAFQIRQVLADFPHDISIQPWTSGTHTILNISITHDTGAPTGIHYVDAVQVNVSGIVHDITLTSQSTVTFVEQYDMGEVTGMPTVQARAHCTVHGWSDWSNTLTVPEFSLASPLLILVVITVAVLLLHARTKNPR